MPPQSGVHEESPRQELAAVNLVTPRHVNPPAPLLVGDDLSQVVTQGEGHEDPAFPVVPIDPVDAHDGMTERLE